MAAFRDPATTAVSDSRAAAEHNLKPFLTLIYPSWHRPKGKASNDPAKLSVLELLR